MIVDWVRAQFHPPQLLMVSGIGPAGTLSAYQNPICADRPGVGQSMWDNTFSGPTHPVNVMTHNSLANPAVIGAAVNEYNTDCTGVLTNSGGDFLASKNFPVAFFLQLHARILMLHTAPIGPTSSTLK